MKYNKAKWAEPFGNSSTNPVLQDIKDGKLIFEPGLTPEELKIYLKNQKQENRSMSDRDKNINFVSVKNKLANKKQKSDF